MTILESLGLDRTNKLFLEAAAELWRRSSPGRTYAQTLGPTTGFAKKPSPSPAGPTGSELKAWLAQTLGARRTAGAQRPGTQPNLRPDQIPDPEATPSTTQPSTQPSLSYRQKLMTAVNTWVKNNWQGWAIGYLMNRGGNSSQSSYSGIAGADPGAFDSLRNTPSGSYTGSSGDIMTALRNFGSRALSGNNPSRISYGTTAYSGGMPVGSLGETDPITTDAIPGVDQALGGVKKRQLDYHLSQAISAALNNPRSTHGIGPKKSRAVGGGEMQIPVDKLKALLRRM